MRKKKYDINPTSLIRMFIVCGTIILLNGCENSSESSQTNLLEDKYVVSSPEEDEKVLLIMPDTDPDGAVFSIENLSDETAEIMYAENTGYGYMAMLEEGFYQVTFSCEGFVTISEPVSIGEENLYILDFYIEEISEETDDEEISENLGEE